MQSFQSFLKNKRELIIMALVVVGIVFAFWFVTTNVITTNKNQETSIAELVEQVRLLVQKHKELEKQYESGKEQSARYKTELEKVNLLKEDVEKKVILLKKKATLTSKDRERLKWLEGENLKYEKLKQDIENSEGKVDSSETWRSKYDSIVNRYEQQEKTVQRLRADSALNSINCACSAKLMSKDQRTKARRVDEIGFFKIENCMLDEFLLETDKIVAITYLKEKQYGKERDLNRSITNELRVPLIGQLSLTALKKDKFQIAVIVIRGQSEHTICKTANLPLNEWLKSK